MTPQISVPSAMAGRNRIQRMRAMPAEPITAVWIPTVRKQNGMAHGPHLSANRMARS